MALHLGIKDTYRQGVEDNSREERMRDLKKKMGEVEMQRCVLTGGRERKKEEREGLKKRDKSAKKGWEIRKVEVIYPPPLSHNGHL